MKARVLAKMSIVVAAFLLGQAVPSLAAPSFVSPPATAPLEKATHAFLLDMQTGTVLLDKNADARMPTSSMSKTLALYLVFDALKQGKLKFDDEILVSEKAWKMEGSRMFIQVGTKVRVEDLVRGVAIQSGNDATVALAEGLAGTEEAFVERMNIRAKELGMTGSHFMNASGWPDPEHYSTPRDLALLAQRLITDFPEYYHYFGEKEFTYNKIYQPNRDPLLERVAGADGIKTGHTEIAGYGLIGSAKRGDRRLILVVNGLPSEQDRAVEAARLLEWGFLNFESKKILTKGQPVAEAAVWLGQEDKVPLVAEKDLIVVVPVAKRDAIAVTAVYKGPIAAPITAGTIAGKVDIVIPEQPPQTVNLLAGKDVERKGVFGRAAARLQYLIGKI